jgi:DNA-binding PadR family transcriptional regulator
MSDADIHTTLSLAILGLVSLEPRSGYDLKKIFSSTPMGHFSASPGAIYPALRRLEERGFVAGIVERKHVLRPRQKYKITEAGMQSLRATLGRPVTRRDIVWHCEELILRFAFIRDVLGKAKTIEFLEILAARIEEYIPSLRAEMAAQRLHGSATGAYALELGIEKYKITVAWAKRVVRALNKSAGGSSR